MLTFTQLCELLTNNQRYSWFLLPSNYLTYLTLDEAKTIHIEKTREQEWMRIWYPKEKWKSRPMEREEVRRQMNDAIEREDWEEVLRLKGKL